MKKPMLVVALLLAATTVAGCSTTPGQVQQDDQKPKKVVVNEGMSKEEEKQLNQRLEELETQVSKESKGADASEAASDSGSAAPTSSEDSGGGLAAEARADAEAYYEAAAAGNYEYTHSQLSSIDRSIFPLGDWAQANQALASDQATYEVTDVIISNPQTAEVTVLVGGEQRYTRFVYEGGSWKHELSMDEVTMFTDAQFSSASASSAASSASSAASASAQPQQENPENTKEVKVVVSAAKPADVDISDDNLEVWRTEQIQGEKTYKFTLPKDVGMDIMVSDAEFRMNNDIYAAVYEDGKLVSEDSDSSMVTITY